MPLLSRRNARPLLQTVNGKRHATQDDHAGQFPTPPSTNSTPSSMNPSNTLEGEDIYRPPDDSSEDETPTLSQLPMSAGFRRPRQIGGTADEVAKPATFKQPTSFTPESKDSKRASFLQPPSSDNDAMIFEEVHGKRRKTFTLTNIHGPPKAAKGYGSKQRRSIQAKSAKGSSFKQLQTAKPKPQDEVSAKPQVKFKLAKGADMFEFGKNESLPELETAAWTCETMPEGAERAYSISSSGSPLSSPRSHNAEDIKDIILPEPQSYKPECALCGEQVDVLLKEAFENQFTQGQPILNYKWQQRFCRWHKEDDAKRVWFERGCPEIDWERLERRMRRHHKRLKDVMNDAQPSYYRDQLREKIKGRSKTAMQVLSSDGAKRGASVGYYGPRGERVMTEHIINHLSDTLRRQSSKDRLVAAAGVSGGVSGFVQAVLVPELAEQLIMEDMKVSSDRSREIIVESAELGELLHPDVDDKVTEVVEV